MSYQRRQKPSKQPRIRKWVIVVIAAALILIIIGATWALRHHSKGTITDKPTSTTTAGQNTKGEPAAGSSNNTGSGNTSSSGGDKNSSGSSTSPPATATLTAPQGNFVSNHHPNLDGSPAPNTEQSVCNTTPGASCQISFTKDGVTKTLPAQTTDSGGAAYWRWKLQDIGLTEGTWKVSAKATLGSQTQTADDVIPFEVGQ
jgi:cytoskeletal protein RodZ